MTLDQLGASGLKGRVLCYQEIQVVSRAVEFPFTAANYISKYTFILCNSFRILMRSSCI